MSVEFRFLELAHYNNAPHFARFEKVREGRKRECTVILPAGAEPQVFFDRFLEHVLRCLESGMYLPIARFCDGEYSFYAGKETTTCWGERKSSLSADGAEEMHVRALRTISREGVLCPNLNMIYVRAQSEFLEFLNRQEMPLQNYAPFYFVYALLVNPKFLAALKGRHIAIITNFRNKNLQNITRIFEGLGAGKLTFSEIPHTGVAQGNFELKLDSRPDIAFVGAGIGAPLVLERLKEQSCVAIDTGFVLHLWDGSFDKYERLFLNYE